jgi:hypothetical protein
MAAKWAAKDFRTPSPNREREQLIQRYVVSIDPHQQVNAPR